MNHRWLTIALILTFGCGKDSQQTPPTAEPEMSATPSPHPSNQTQPPAAVSESMRHCLLKLDPPAGQPSPHGWVSWGSQSLRQCGASEAQLLAYLGVVINEAQ
jgi:hypothetical protein